MHIITCCTKQDISTFEWCLINIKKYIKFSKIILCVPDDDLNEFINIFGDIESIIIKKDSEVLSKDLSIFILNSLKTNNNQKFYGWYLQQFIKITEAAKFDENYPVLIWDSDTIPLRPLSFVNKDNTLNYYVGDEYHEPYFNTIKKLLNYEKVIPQSFIAQCFPLYSRHAKNLIEVLGGSDAWIHKVMGSLDVSSNCSFSEYETLGTFISNTDPTVIKLCFAKWNRNGYRDIFIKGSIKKAIHMNTMSYAFVAIEKPNRSKVKYIATLIFKKFISVL